MSATVHGIHHVTVIAGDPAENLHFYRGILGMRLVKKSVNQDAPDTYHLFYADGAGNPGSDLTFFPWPQMAAGYKGAGLTSEVPLAIPAGSMAYWQERLQQFGVLTGGLEMRFGERTLPFSDPHGLALALTEIAEARDYTPWQDSPVPAEKQIMGMHSVRFLEHRLEPTAALLLQLGFQKLGEEEGWHRYGVDGGGSGKIAEIRVLPEERRGRWGPGIVHHVAWRVTDTAEEMAVRSRVAQAGLSPTPQIDRFWFKSVYFKEPGGVLFELATDGPGFGIDEAPEKLGERLILPPWLEPQRADIEAALPALNTDNSDTAPQ